MKKSIRETVSEAILPTVTELGYRLWDVTYTKIGADYHLEITIDKDGGIDIQDCERVHRAIDPILDEVDPIDCFYYLEVSSPGAERELRTDDHIAHSLGERVEIKLFADRHGAKSHIGTLESYEDGVITLSVGGESIGFARSDVSKIKTVYFEN